MPLIRRSDGHYINTDRRPASDWVACPVHPSRGRVLFCDACLMAARLSLAGELIQMEQALPVGASLAVLYRTVGSTLSDGLHGAL